VGEDEPLGGGEPVEQEAGGGVGDVQAGRRRSGRRGRWGRRHGGARPGGGVHRHTAGAAHHAGPYACRRVGADTVGRGRAGVGGILGADASRASAPVSERVVETEFVFDRLQAAELSAAHRILVPERPLAQRARRSGSEPCR
jgi:hypothetical protein